MYTKSLVCKSQGRRSIGRPGYRRKDNIKIELPEIGCEGTYWMHLAEDKFW
jgi:hypothetical protein